MKNTESRLAIVERQLQRLVGKITGGSPAVTPPTPDEAPEERAEREALRAAVFGRFEKNVKDHAEVVGRRCKAIVAAAEAESTAREAYSNAALSRTQAQRESEEINRRFDRERQEMERELVALADPRIESFVGELVAELAALVHGPGQHEFVEREVDEEVDLRHISHLFLRPVSYSTRPSREARIDGLQRLIAEAKHLKISGAPVDAELARLRKELRALPDAGRLERVA